MDSLDARGRWKSAGRRMLVRILATMSATAVARQCDTSKQVISALATGTHRFPTLPVAVGLSREFGIAVEAWTSDCAGAAVVNSD